MHLSSHQTGGGGERKKEKKSIQRLKSKANVLQMAGGGKGGTLCVCVCFCLWEAAPLKKKTQKQSVTFQSSSSHTDKNTDATEPPSCPLPSPTSWCHSTASSSHKRFIVTDKATSPLLWGFSVLTGRNLI